MKQHTDEELLCDENVYFELSVAYKGHRCLKGSAGSVPIHASCPPCEHPLMTSPCTHNLIKAGVAGQGPPLYKRSSIYT